MRWDVPVGLRYGPTEALVATWNKVANEAFGLDCTYLISLLVWIPSLPVVSNGLRKMKWEEEHLESRPLLLFNKRRT